MSVTTPETAIKAHFDRAAKQIQIMQGASVGGTTHWAIDDAANDETYENAMKGTDMTAVDTAIAAAGDIFSATDPKKLFTMLNDYLRIKLSLASPYLATYLATVGWRVPYEAALAYTEACGVTLPTQWVFAKGTRVASEADPASSGMHQFGYFLSTAYTSVSGALPSTVKGAPVVMVSDEGSITGTMVALATLQDATTKQVAFTQSAAANGQVILGQQTIGAAGAAAGQTTIPVAATAQFKAAEYALVVKADLSVQELILIASLTTNTSLTTTTNLINSFAQNDLVLPMFRNVARQSGTASASIYAYAWPDRIIAL